MMNLRVHAATDIGCVRQRNEDSFLVDEANGVFAVADGLGGLEGGDLASRTAIESVREAVRRDPDTALSDLTKLFHGANAAVLKSTRAAGFKQAATTLTLASTNGKRVRIAHVGDSFALLVRDGECHPLTREHNVENESDDMFELAPYPPSYRYALTRVVGQTQPLKVDIIEQELRAGDCLVLATDGLTDRVPLLEIAAACLPSRHPESTVDTLIQAALERGGHDNVTVAVIQVVEE